MMKNIALVFARGGSKGLLNKNIIKLNGKPLIYYAISLAKNSKIIDDIYVSTEDFRISKIANNYGAKIIKRPKYLATDNSPEIKSWQHAIKYLNKKNIFPSKIFVLPTTSPLRNQNDLNKASKMLNSKTDIVISITETNHNPYFNMVKLNNQKYCKLIMKSKKKYYRRQEAPKVYNMTTSIYATTPKYILNSKNIFDGKVKGLMIPFERSIDIDNKFDFELAKIFFRNIK